MTTENSFKITDRNRVRRVSKRALYDRESVYRIFDQAWISHVAIEHTDGPMIIPMLHARLKNNLIFHGATTSRLMKYLSSGKTLSISVAIPDGIVLARSLFHHSMNYRSVVAFGTGRRIDCEEQKMNALKAISDKVMPNRWNDARLPNEKEMKATAVVSVEIESASAKVRTGGPVDDPEDYSLDFWAGVVPIQQEIKSPIPDTALNSNTDLPSYISNFIQERNLSETAMTRNRP